MTSTSKSTITVGSKAIPASAFNPRLRIGTRDKNVGWFTPTITSLPQPTQELFENYSQIGSSYIIPHILQIRDRAWEIHPYPFLGLLHFTNLTLSTTPSYAHILTSLSSSSSTKLLDLGCGLGQDLRKLIYDGAPAGNVYGVDSRNEFLELGYELFNDKATFGAKLIAGDLFDKDGKGRLKKHEGKFTYIFIGLFMHAFDYKTQVKACEKMVKLCRNDKGVMIIGHQVGSTEAGEVATGGGRMMYKHNVKSFEMLWGEVGKKTGTKWSVWAWLEDEGGEKREWEDEGTRRLVFEVARIG